MNSTSLLIACLILNFEAPLVAQTNFNPAFSKALDSVKSFKSAQKNLTDVFLQLAGSLEQSSSPEAYLRHVLAEDARVSALLAGKTGRPSSGRLPAHFNKAYVDRLVKNWNTLSPKLGLDAFAKGTGQCVREGIKGTRGTGTIVVETLNRHQREVIAGMKSGSMKGADFEALRAKLASELEFNKEKVDTFGYGAARRDAVSCGVIFRSMRRDLFGKLDNSLPPGDAARVKAVIDSILLDLGRAAQAEFEIGMAEWSISGNRSPL